MEFTLGQMDDPMKGIIETIKNSDMGPILGQTEESILDNGKMIKGTGEEHM